MGLQPGRYRGGVSAYPVNDGRCGGGGVRLLTPSRPSQRDAVAYASTPPNAMATPAQLCGVKVWPVTSDAAEMSSTRRTACSTTCVTGEVISRIWNERRLYTKCRPPHAQSAARRGAFPACTSRQGSPAATTAGRSMTDAKQQSSLPKEGSMRMGFRCGYGYGCGRGRRCASRSGRAPVRLWGCARGGGVGQPPQQQREAPQAWLLAPARRAHQ